MSNLKNAFRSLLPLESSRSRPDHGRPDPVAAVTSAGKNLKRSLDSIFDYLETEELGALKEQFLTIKPIVEKVAGAASSYDGIIIDQHIWDDSREAENSVLMAIRSPSVEANPEIRRRVVALLNYAYGIAVCLEYAGLKPTTPR